MIGYDIDADGIATLTWDIPGRSMNVLNEATIEAFSTAFRKAVADDAVKGIIITSGKDAFLAGADLEMFLTMPTDDAAQLMAFASDLQGRFREIETCGKPVAAAINGTALGGGLEICLASHYRVAADRPKVQIGQPEVKIGLLPGAGGTQRIPRLIGARAALPLLLEGKSVNPKQAAQMGIIHKVVPADELLAEAKRWILEEGDPVQPWDKKGFKVPDGAVQSPKGYETFVAGNAMLHEKTWGNYEAPEAIISAVYEGLQVPIEGGLRIESRYLVSLLQGKQTRAMIRTLFFSMGDANKLKARPDAAPPADYAKIGVLGAGMMGAGIAHVSALSGLEVVLLDTSAELAEGGKAHSAGLLEKRVKRNRMSPEERDTVLGRIQPTDDFRALAGCELVIEAVFEHQGRRDPKDRGGAGARRGLRLQHLDAPHHRPGRGLVQARQLHRPPLLLAGGPHAAGGDHPRRGNLGRLSRPGDGLRQAHPQDPDRGQRQPRLLHQPGIRDLCQRGSGDAGRRRDPGADRERRPPRGHAGGAVGYRRRGLARAHSPGTRADQA
jgi:3-hydroxyacyl-CoA dehydrogenase/enoyl-CoA hydratase/3-hydroxybutyryl-CoA epimerase